MSSYFSQLAEELSARRRRLRVTLGDRSQSLLDFAVLAGLLLGSAGLFLKPWMVSAAPWGFAAPVLFLIGFLLLEARRQRAPARTPDEDGEAIWPDWIVVAWSLACAGLGAAAFFVALAAEPAPPPEPEVPEWNPPDNGVTFELDTAPAPAPTDE